jgi:cytochrome P450
MDHIEVLFGPGIIIANG